jgi:hypothetical protein
VNLLAIREPFRNHHVPEAAGRALGIAVGGVEDVLIALAILLGREQLAERVILVPG